MTSQMEELIAAELDGCRNLLGQPLRPDAIARITRLWACPTSLTWDAAYSIVLNRNGVTLWQAVTLVSPGRSPLLQSDLRLWTNVPDRLTILDAINYAARAVAAEVQADE